MTTSSSSMAKTQIAEIVTFSLNEGVSEDTYLALSDASKDYIRTSSGFVTRQLSKTEDGIWTDYTVWNSLKDAETAAAGFMEQDFAPAMLGAIDAKTMTMRHQKIFW